MVSLGIVASELALRADGRPDRHPLNRPWGSQDVLITLDDKKSGERHGDTEVIVETPDSCGHTKKKTLLRTHSGGLPPSTARYLSSGIPARI